MIVVAAGCVGLSNLILIAELNFCRGRRQFAAISLYRQAEILKTALNQLLRNLIVFILVYNMTFEIASGLYLLSENKLGLGAKTETGLTAATLTVAGNGLLGIIIVFGFCADVYLSSREGLRLMNAAALNANLVGKTSMATVLARRKERIIRKMLGSLRIVKVEFGNMNFIDKLTPIRFQNFTTCRLIDALLMLKSH